MVLGDTVMELYLITIFIISSDTNNSLHTIFSYFSFNIILLLYVIIKIEDADCQINMENYRKNMSAYISIWYTIHIYNNNNNNNCLKSNIQCIEIRVQWTVHLGSSHMHVHAVTRVHAVTPKLVICVMYLTSI